MAFSATAYNFRQPPAVLHRFPPCNLLSSRPHVLVFNKENRSPVFCLAGRSKGGLMNLLISPSVYNWSQKQCFLVGAVGYTVYCSMQGFIGGFLIDKALDLLCPMTPIENSKLLLALGGARDYYPLFSSMMAGPLIYGRNAAVFIGSTEFIIYVILRLRGKKSFTQTSMAGSFGGGIILSLVTGMRAPASVISVGVIFALAYGLAIKYITGVPDSWK